MSQSFTSRNNVLAGAFLVGGVALAMLISALFADIGDRVGSFREYVIEFTIADGAAGIQDGSPVLLGGQSVGRVTEVETPTDADGIPESIRVTVAIRSFITLHDDAIAMLEKPILGSLSSINIPYAGGAGGNPLPENGVLKGRIAPAFLAQAGLGPDAVQDIRDMISDARDFSATIRRIALKIDPTVEPSIENIDVTLQTLRDMAERFDQRSLAWKDRIDTVLANAEQVTEDAKPIPGEISEGIEEYRGVATSARSMMDDNRESIEEIIANVRETTAHVREVSVLKIDEVLDKGLIAAGNIETTSADVSRLIAEQTPAVRRTLTNVRQVSDNARLFLDEVRAEPWRLLNRPKTKELEMQLLYDAARAYASAVADLRIASETLGTVETRSGMVDADIRDHLDRAFGRYADAEHALLEILSTRINED